MWTKKRISLLLLFIVALTTSTCVAETEVKWTPNEQDQDNGGGPLPLSSNQREQLLQLEQAIMSSPDPQGTLMQVAEANNLDPQELVNMLQRNKQDMQQGGGGGGGGGGRRIVSSWPQMIFKSCTSIGVLLSHSAAKNPKAFSLMALALLFVIHVAISAPRNGFILSSRNGLLSKGHTTMFEPPPRYISKLLESPSFARKQTSFKQRSSKSTTTILWNDSGLQVSEEEEGRVVHYKPSRKTKLAQAVSIQATIRMESLLPSSKRDSKRDNDDNDDNDDEQEERESVLSDLVYEAAANVLISRRFSEFVSDGAAWIQSSLDTDKSTIGADDLGIMVVPKAGVWGRFGLQPLKISDQHETETFTSVIYSTLNGGIFDGQLSFLVEQDSRQGDISIQIVLAVPKRGRKLSKKICNSLLTTLSESIVSSVTTQAKQKLVRQVQGKAYRARAKTRATQRRATRFEQAKKMEEMAEDRRRRWQRANPDAGRYRPSGKRMISPNNC